MFSQTSESYTPRTSSEVIQTHPLSKRCLAECIGTAFLIYIGCGALTAANSYLLPGNAAFTMADLVGVALPFGLALSVMIYALGHISGCHINPAVTIALATVRRISWGEAGAYVLAQLLGGLLGALLIAVTFGRTAARVIGYGASNYDPLFVNYFGAIVGEAIATFFLLFVIMAVVIDKRTNTALAGLMVGLTLALGIFVTAAATGGNLNPARAFGPILIQMLFGGSYPFSHMFIYFIGPIIGGIAGAFAYDYLAGLSRMRETRETHYGHIEPGD